MYITRRKILESSLLASIGVAFDGFSNASAHASLRVRSRGNPLFPGLGACDPQVRVYDNEVYMYSTHDASPQNTSFVMNDWRVWHTTDLVNWEMVSVLTPEETYFEKPSRQCWATDAARREGRYYFYFSMGPENIGVVEGNSPAGPWHDPLRHALVAQGSVKTEARDPGILQEPDGTSYIVFGTFDYYIARLNEDMISLAEQPRFIQIRQPQGPYGKGKTDDKPFLHRRGNKYYLSWGCYYAMSESPYGPYECKGSIIQADRVAPEFRDVSKWKGPTMIPAQGAPKDWLTFDRHGSFFELFGQWYFICNDQSQPGTSPFFRDSILSYVRYRENGEIDPIRITTTGVGQYDAQKGMDATDFFQSKDAQIREKPDGSFEVCALKNGSYLVYPQVRNLRPDSKLVVEGRLINSQGLLIEVRRGTPTGHEIGEIKIAQGAAQKQASWTIPLQNVRETEDICLIFRGGPRESVGIDHLSFI